MDYRHQKPRINIQGDRLSMLPDDLIHKILSFISIKYAIQTSRLSSRWRYIWTTMPYLNISTKDFINLPKFVYFLSRYNINRIDLYSASLRLHGYISEALLKGILDYAFSRNVQQLNVICLLDDKISFPLYLFCSRSLKHLSVTGSDRDVDYCVLDSTCDLPSLTTLCLDRVTFLDDDLGVALFSKCANLNSLTITNFAMMKAKTFVVSHPLLSNLTLEGAHWRLNDVKVVAPQLKNLTIRSSFGNHLITAPNLATICFRSSHLLRFSTNMHSLEKVDLIIYSTHKWSGSRIVGLLQQIRSVKFLTLNLEFIEPLTSYMERVPRQPSLFTNLKSLKIYPVRVDEAHKKVNVSNEVISYLLDGSPTATFTKISYEDIKEQQQKARVFANANHVSSSQALLEKEKANAETRMNLWKQSVEKMQQLHFEMTRYSEDGQIINPVKRLFK